MYAKPELYAIHPLEIVFWVWVLAAIVEEIVQYRQNKGSTFIIMFCLFIVYYFTVGYLRSIANRMDIVMNSVLIVCIHPFVKAIIFII